MNAPSSRRALLAGMGAAAIGVVAVSATPAGAADYSDAALIALCDRLETVARRVNGLFLQGVNPRVYVPATYIENDKERDKACAPLEEELDDLFDQITDQPVKTLAGAQAVARCLMLTECELRHDAEEIVEGVQLSYRGAFVMHWLLTCLTGGEISWANCMTSPGQVES